MELYGASGVCCTPANAWTWTRELAGMALAGDADALRVLPDAVEHYLQAIRVIPEAPALEGHRGD